MTWTRHMYETKGTGFCYQTQTKFFLLVRLSSIMVNGLHQTDVTVLSLPLGGTAVNTRSYTCGRSSPSSLFSLGCCRRMWMASRIFRGNKSCSRSIILADSQLIVWPESIWCSDKADDRVPDVTDFFVPPGTFSVDSQIA